MTTTNLRWAAFGAAGLMIIGALGTWAVLDGNDLISTDGPEHQGKRIIVCAVIYALTIFWFRRRLLLLIAALAAAVATVTSVVRLQDIESEPLVNAGWGLWLDAVASVLALLLVIALRRRPRDS